MLPHLLVASFASPVSERDPSTSFGTSFLMGAGAELRRERAVGSALLRLMRATHAHHPSRGDLAGLAPALAEECARLVTGSECLVGEVDEPDRQDLVVVGSAGEWAAAYGGRHRPLEGTLAGRAYATGRPAESVRGAGDVGEREPLDGGTMGAVRMIPLRLATDSGTPAPVIGMLAVFRARPVPFSAGERSMLDTYAEVVGMTLSHAGACSQASTRDVVHDIRGPLTVVAGYIDMMRNGVFGEAPEPWANPVDIVHGKAAELNAMLDGFLAAELLEDLDPLGTEFGRVEPH